MARKPRGPEDYTREELLLMAEKVNLKYRSRKSKEQLYDELGLGEKSAAPARRSASTRKTAAAVPERGGQSRVTPTARRAAAMGAAAPLGMPEAPLPTVTASSIPVPSPFARPAARPGPYIDRGPDLPSSYGDDRLEALVRDPRAIFTYWELAGGAYERARAGKSDAELAGAVWVLRVCRVADGQFFDIPIDPSIGNWYLHVEPASAYQIKIGLVLASGSFLELATSRVINTPPDSVSTRVDEQWMLVSEEFERLIDYTITQHGRAPGSAQMGELRRRREAVRRKVVEFPWNITSRITSPGVSSWMTSPRGGASRIAPPPSSTSSGRR